MSEEHVKGGLEKAGGRIKEAAGALVGNQRLKTEGQFDQVKGDAHQAWGDVKDAAKDLAARLRTTPADRSRDPLDPTEQP
jgi:uncharacterized protein YjbJ (UPF0337 family)